MRPAKIVGVALILAGIAGLVLALRVGRSSAPPTSLGTYPDASVVVVTLDTTRADRLGCYGSPAGLTPVMDGLAAEGIVFEHAQSVAPVTLPAHASIFTGLSPVKHGVRNNGMFVLPDEVETLAEVFAADGYATGAFVSAEVVTRRYGLDQGFDVYDDDLSKSRRFGQTMVPSRRGGVTLEAATAWLDTVPPDKPVFLWLHLYDPHAPYDPPPPFRSRFPGDPYGGEIAYADAVVGELLAYLEETGRLSDTVFTVLGDHGEGLGEHGEQTHGFLLHQATIHVPWILRTPGMTRPSRVVEPVSVVDLAPLVTALVGADNPNDGRSDGRLPFGVPPADPRSIYYEAMLPMFQYGWSELRGLRVGSWELQAGTRDELFDLRSDPRQLTDLADVETLELDSLRTRLDAVVAEDDTLDTEVALDLAPSEREALAALGYLATTAPPRRDPPDPRDLVSGHVHIERAQMQMAAGRYDEALAGIDAMLTQDPQNIAALTLKGRVQMTMGDADLAEQTWRRSLEIDPANSDVVAALCTAELQRGRYEESISLARLGRTTRSPFGIFDALEARALAALGRRGEATEVVESALAENPDDPDLLSVRATWSIERGRFEEAEADLTRAVQVSPFHQRSRRQLAALLESAGRRQDAVAVYEEMLRIQPEDGDTHFQLGSLLLDSDLEAALPHLEEACRLAPARPNFLTTLGVAYINAGRMAEAEAALRRALTITPDDPSVSNNLGIVLIRGGRFDEAVDVLTGLLAVNPGFVAARNNLAIALAESGDLEDAEMQVRRALERSPDYLDAWLTLAAILDRAARYEDEYVALNRAHALAPERPDVRDRLAVAAARVGRCAHTLELVAAEMDRPGDMIPGLNLEVARCLEQGGRVGVALRHFEEAARKSQPGPVRDEAQAGVARVALLLQEEGG